MKAFKLLLPILFLSSIGYGQTTPWSTSPAITGQTRTLSGSPQIRWLFGSNLYSIEDSLAKKISSKDSTLRYITPYYFNHNIGTSTQIALNLKAPLASPALTGTPTTPTPGSNINTIQIVNGAWVNTYYAPISGGGSYINAGTSAVNQNFNIGTGIGIANQFNTANLRGTGTPPTGDGGSGAINITSPGADGQTASFYNDGSNHHLSLKWTDSAETIDGVRANGAIAYVQGLGLTLAGTRNITVLPWGTDNPATGWVFQNGYGGDNSFGSASSNLSVGGTGSFGNRVAISKSLSSSDLLSVANTSSTGFGLTIIAASALNIGNYNYTSGAFNFTVLGNGNTTTSGTLGIGTLPSGTVSTDAILVNHSGTVGSVPGNSYLTSSTGVTAVTASGNLSSSGGTTPNITITASPTFSSVIATAQIINTTANKGSLSGYYAVSSLPSLALNQTTGGTDAKLWDIDANPNTLSFVSWNDAETLGDTWLSVGRTGYNITSVSFGTHIVNAAGFNSGSNTSHVVLGDGTLGTYNSGTLTSIATTQGILGGTITNTGTLKADTTYLQTVSDFLTRGNSYWLLKGATTLPSSFITSSLTSAAGGSFGTLAYSSATIPTVVTSGYIPYSTSGNYANSKIYQTSTGIGLNTTAPTRSLSIDGGGSDVYLSLNESGVEKWDIGNEVGGSNRLAIYNTNLSGYPLLISNSTGIGSWLYGLQVGSSNQFSVNGSGNVTAVLPTYSSGGYLLAVTNTGTNRLESISTLPSDTTTVVSKANSGLQTITGAKYATGFWNFTNSVSLSNSLGIQSVIPGNTNLSANNTSSTGYGPIFLGGTATNAALSIRNYANAAAFDVYGDGHVVLQSTMQLKGYTVSTLPSGTTGMITYVTDALSPSFGVILVGGGSTVIPAFYNGTNWVGY